MSAETPDDRSVDAEEEAAAAEAGHIGGDPPDYPDDDPSQRPLEEAGEGESEGFELAEEDLIEEASHGDERRSPEVDGWEEGEGAEEADSVYGDADDVEPDDL
jgi:hypothetical protein